MRKKIKSMGFTDWQTSFYNNAISIPILLGASMVTEGWSSVNFEKNLYVFVQLLDVVCRLRILIVILTLLNLRPLQPRRRKDVPCVGHDLVRWSCRLHQFLQVRLVLPRPRPRPRSTS